MKSTRRCSGIAAHLLWVDGIGAVVAGVAVLSLSGWLSQLEGLPQELLIFTGVVNLLYACYSLPLAMRSERSVRQIRWLVQANLAWTVVCFLLLVIFRSDATPFALLHIGGEGLYVGMLALLEWRYRDLLRAP